MSSAKLSYTIRFRLYVAELSKRYDQPITNNGYFKKRTYEETFGNRNYDIERYGQKIGSDYFNNNIGHGVKQ